MDIATLLRLTAARTTPTAGVTLATRVITPKPHASTSEAPTSTVVAIIIIPRVTVTGTAISVIIEGFLHRPVRIVRH